MNDTLRAVATHMRSAKNILFVTGAGLSADSGLPTYRGVGGLYDDRTTDEGVPIEVALSGQMFAARPEITWKYLWQIGAACRAARFNRGHEVIAAIERDKPGTWVLTQNVDGLHRQAGSRRLIEIHGHAFDLRCTGCGLETSARELIGDYGEPDELPPRCPQCRDVVRPDVVLFNELLPARAMQQLDEMSNAGIDMVVAVGTSAMFPYIVQPVHAARRAGLPTVEINPGDTELSHLVDHCIREPGAIALDRLWRLMYG